MKENEINKIMENITEDGNMCIIRESLRQFKGEKIEIEATDGEDFTKYVYKNGTPIKEGVVIGYEYEYPNEDDELEINDGIFYA